MLRKTSIAVLCIAPALALAAQQPPAGDAGRTRQGEQFRRADTDANGMLSRAEAEKGMPRIAKDFDAIDANRDGQVTPDEVRAWRRGVHAERRAKREAAKSRFDQYFARADANGDGALSREEAGKSMPRVAKNFERIDTDHDGRVTRDELRAWLRPQPNQRPQTR